MGLPSGAALGAVETDQRTPQHSTCRTTSSSHNIIKTEIHHEAGFFHAEASTFLNLFCFVDVTLDPRKKYHVKLLAYNVMGDGYQADQTISTPGCVCKSILRFDQSARSQPDLEKGEFPSCAQLSEIDSCLLLLLRTTCMLKRTVPLPCSCTGVSRPSPPARSSTTPSAATQ